MPHFRTLEDLDCRGKRVLLRADLNVPLQDGAVTDATRIERLVPTIEALAKQGARIVVLSHFGRPRGRPDPAFSLQALVQPLSRAIGRPVAFAEDCIGEPARRVVAALRPGEVALLENLRFHPGEEANDPGFARALAELGDVYVDDAFSAAHRAHASIATLPRLLPAAAGLSMQAELEALAAALERPARPVLALVGGAKVSTKLDLLRFLIGKVEVLAIGGAMANTLLFARGVAVGRSLCERDMVAAARRLFEEARERGCRVLLPEDAGFAAALEEARTLVWNGPLGAFETPPFDAGTTAVARKAAALTGEGRLLSVAGGGDTVAALARAGVEGALSYVSTAGGAFLEWLEGRELPGVAALAAEQKA